MNLAKEFLLLFVLLFTFSSLGKAEPLTKVRAPVPLVKITGEYQKISDVKDLPLVIIDYFNRPVFDIPMVNPESKFNSSRGTQLVAAGNAGDVWFIEFLMGGTGLSQTFMAFRVKDNVITSLGSVYQGQLVNLSIEELAENLPLTISCTPKKKIGCNILIRPILDCVLPHEKALRISTKRA